MLLSICNYDYFENSYGPVLRLVCRDRDNERVIVDVQDDILTPHMYILAKDWNLFYEILYSNMLENLITSTERGTPTEYDEETICVYAKYPRHIRKIRDNVVGIRSYNADIKWEKMAIQKLGWKQFIEIEDGKYSEYGFTPISAISPSEEMFKVNFNICYWDIETDSSMTKGKQFSDCKFAYKISIISYVTFNKMTKAVTYYGWKKDWNPKIIETKFSSHIGKKARKMPRFADYPKEFSLTIKMFNDEKEMHSTFITDFSYGEYDGLSTFNGRGGNRIIKGRRKWFTGFDFPMFYERCLHLGLYEKIQQMSPIAPTKKWGRISQDSVKRRIRKSDQGIETGREYFIKCVPQHDIYYDDMVLFYTKNEHEMKRHNLDTFLNYFLGFGKVPHTGLMVWELFKADWQKEMEYNIVDVEGLYALDIFFGYTDDVALRALAYGGKIEDGVYASKLHDHIKLWFTSGKYVLPTREYGRKIQRQDQWQGLINKKFGGFNLEVDPDVIGYHYVQLGFIIDFSKLYPSCSRSVNADTRTKVNLDKMSLDTKGLWLHDRNGKKYAWNDLARSPSGFFRRDIDAIDTIIYNELIKMRMKYAKNAGDYAEKKSHATNEDDRTYYNTMYKAYYAAQFSFKGLINGKFGADGMEGNRSFDMVVYNTPPSMGQELIKFVIKWLADRGYKSLLASTDSAISLARSKTPQEAWDEVQALIVELNSDLEKYAIKEFNIKDNYINIGCEKLFNVAVIFDKRRYMLNTVMKEEGGRVIVMDRPEAYFRGMEYVRRDSAAITHDVQKTLMDMVRSRAPKEDILKYIRKINSEFRSYGWEYICGRGGISNSIDEGTGQKYTSARNSNKYLGKQYDGGSNPLLAVFIKHPLHLGEHYIPPGPIPMSFDEQDQYMLRKKGFDIDYEHLKEIHLKKKVEPLLGLLFGMTYMQAITGDDLLDV